MLRKNDSKRIHSIYQRLGELADGDRLPLIRLRYIGSASTWGFGLYLASSGKYENQILPTGPPIGTPKRPSTVPATSTSATDQGRPPKDLRAGPLSS